jgi:hypothetical protein
LLVPCNIYLNQAIKGVNSGHTAIVDLLKSIEDLLKRIGIYTRIPSTPATDEAVFKIIVELLSTLALATKDLKHGRSSESIITDSDVPYSV